MICKIHKNRMIRSLCLGLFLFACCSFFGCLSSSKVSALTNIGSANIYRSYLHSGIGTPTLNENVGSQTIPYTALTYSQGVYKLLYQVVGATYIGDVDYSYKYKTLYVNGIFKQYAIYSDSNPLKDPNNVVLEVTAHKHNQSNSLFYDYYCSKDWYDDIDHSITQAGYYYMSISCKVQLEDYYAIDSFSLTVGSNSTAIYQTPFGTYDWGYVGDYTLIAPGARGMNSDLVFNSFSYDIKSTNDPVIAGQDLLIDINQNILNQFNSQLEQDQKDRDSLSSQKDQNNVDASNAGDAATQANSTFFGALWGIYGTLLHPIASDCVISGVQVYDLNLGNLDFCTGFTIPSAFTAIGSLVMLGLVVALSYAVLRTAIGLYHSFLGGGK